MTDTRENIPSVVARTRPVAPEARSSARISSKKPLPSC